MLWAVVQEVILAVEPLGNLWEAGAFATGQSEQTDENARMIVR
jgi:hypothetical protein